MLVLDGGKAWCLVIGWGAGDVNSRSWAHWTGVLKQPFSMSQIQIRALLVARTVKTLPALRELLLLSCLSRVWLCVTLWTVARQAPLSTEMGIQSLGWEDFLEMKIAACFCSLTWKIPWAEEPHGLQCMESQKSGTYRNMCFREERKWNTCWCLPSAKL